MIHFQNVDTAIVFRHPAGPPFRRALRDLYVPFFQEWDSFRGAHTQSGSFFVGPKSTLEGPFKPAEPMSVTPP